LALFGLVGALLATGCARREVDPYPVDFPVAGGPTNTTSGTAPRVGAPMSAPYQVGIATWYGQYFAGKKTANGERFDPRAMTAAHRTLPFGTWVEVRRISTGATVRVRVNDRGPWGHAKRVIDLSQGAAEMIGFHEVGMVKVEIRVVSGPL
jgi:rare lipoprotein A